jgi:hypothetical protein
VNARVSVECPLVMLGHLRPGKRPSDCHPSAGTGGSDGRLGVGGLHAPARSGRHRRQPFEVLDDPKRLESLTGGGGPGDHRHLPVQVETAELSTHHPSIGALLARALRSWTVLPDIPLGGSVGSWRAPLGQTGRLTSLSRARCSPGEPSAEGPCRGTVSEGHRSLGRHVNRRKLDENHNERA